jgi:hypothetical protein
MFTAIVGMLMVADMSLLVTGKRILLHETRVTQLDQIMEPSQVQPEIGELPQEILRCDYWTGRAILSAEFNYASNNIFGRDSCQFLYTPA